MREYKSILSSGQRAVCCVLLHLLSIHSLKMAMEEWTEKNEAIQFNKINLFPFSNKIINVFLTQVFNCRNFNLNSIQY